jgi:hypothetical protein
LLESNARDDGGKSQGEKCPTMGLATTDKGSAREGFDEVPPLPDPLEHKKNGQESPVNRRADLIGPLGQSTLSIFKGLA